MKRIITQLGKEIERRLAEVESLKQARTVLAKLVPGHPYSRPKLTAAKLKVKGGKRKKLHWTQTPKGRKIMAKWARERSREA